MSFALKCLLFIFGFSFLAAETPHVIVSVAPHRYLVERIAGDTVAVDLLVPTGASAHTYEPTPKQVLTTAKAVLWFRMGEGFEPYVLRAMQAHNPGLIVVDLRDGVDMISGGDEHCVTCQCHGKHSQDLHFWLSARQAQIQARTITATLSRLFPDNRNMYEANLKTLIQDLVQTDQYLTQQLAPIQQRLMLVSHPAYAYFGRDYNFRQLSIEIEGKDPTPQAMNKLLQSVKPLHLRQIYVQPQYSPKGAQLFAKELNAKIVTLDPYAENIIEALHTIANALLQGDHP